MGWTDDFLGFLEQRQRSPLYRLESLSADLSEGWAAGRSWAAGTHQSGRALALINPRSIRLEGSRLQARTWNISIGGFSLELVSHESLFETGVRRGNWMALYMGFEGQSDGDFERIAFGVLDSVVQISHVRWQLRVLGPLAGLRSRYVQDPKRASFVSGMPTTELVGTLGGGTTFADFSTGSYPQTVAVKSTSGFNPASPHDMGLVIDDDGSVFRYSAKGSVTFVVEADSYLGSAAPASRYSAGAEVRQAAVYDGHPITLLKRFLASSGSFAGGDTGDVYISQCGMGMPTDYVDATDMAVWEGKRKPASGQWRMQFALTQPQVNGLSFIQSILGRAGFWPVMRQGRFSARAALNPFEGFGGTPKHTITDADISRVESIDVFSAANPAEYGFFTAQASTTVTADVLGGTVDVDTDVSTTWKKDTLQTRPGAKTYTVDLSGTIYTNEAEILAEVASASATWGGVVPMVADVLVYGWHWARLVEGDWVLLTTDRIPAFRGDTIDSGGYRNKQAMVLGVVPFLGPYSRVTLCIVQDYGETITEVD